MSPLPPILGALLALARPHPQSISSTRVLVDAAKTTVSVELVCQAATLSEALAVDLDGDKRLDAHELELGHARIEHYVLERFHLARTSEREAPIALAGRLTGLRSSRPAGSKFAEANAGPPDGQWTALDLSFTSPKPVDALEVDFGLFFETNPAHRDYAQADWPGEEPQYWQFSAENALFTFKSGKLQASEERARIPGVLRKYVEHGIEHILSGWDHLAFLVALLVASRRHRQLLVTITAFTLAHSVTLALAAFDVVNLPSSWVETAIALSIAYVAALNLFWKRERNLWSEAFGFGLIHGLGFAGSLAEILLSEKQKISALVGFNAGVELGQLGVVALACLALALVRALAARAGTQAPPPEPAAAGAPATARERAGLAPGWLSTAVSGLVLVCGLYWTVQRAFFT